MRDKVVVQFTMDRMYYEHPITTKVIAAIQFLLSGKIFNFETWVSKHFFSPNSPQIITLDRKISFLKISICKYDIL